MRRLLVASPLLAALVLDVTPASAQTPAAPFRLNEDWMWFSLSNHVDTADGRPFNDGWSPVVAGQILADQRVMPGSAVRFTFSQGATRVGELRCSLPPGHEPPATVDIDCTNPELRFRVTGDVRVEAAYIDGQTDAVTPLRSFSLHVGTIARTRNTIAWIPDVTENFISQHDRLYDTVMHGPGDDISNFDGTGFAVINFWVSTADSEHEYEGDFRCSVDGQRLAPPARLESAFEWGGLPVRRINLMASRPPTAPGGVNPIREELRFTRVRIRLPITFASRGGPPARQQAWALEDHPGLWSCEWRNEGIVVRSFRFRVANGRLVPHPEQAAGYNLPDGAILVETVVPPDSPVDARTDPALVRRGSGYGRPWVTESARAVAAAVPAIGQPQPPAPTGPIFGPEATREGAAIEARQQSGSSGHARRPRRRRH